MGVSGPGGLVSWYSPPQRRHFQYWEMLPILPWMWIFSSRFVETITTQSWPTKESTGRKPGSGWKKVPKPHRKRIFACNGPPSPPSHLVSSFPSPDPRHTAVSGPLLARRASRLYIFFEEVELLRDAEPVVDAAAALFEEAGMGASAAALRSGLPIQTIEAAFAIAHVLKEAQCNEVVADLAFWAEGAILAAADGEIDLFNDCLMMVRRVMLEAWPQFAQH